MCCVFILFYFFLYSKLLHRVLVAEVNALQGMAAIGQRPLLMEVRKMCTTAYELQFGKCCFSIAINPKMLTWGMLPGGKHNPSACCGTQSCSEKFKCETQCAALLEEPGGDAADCLPC